MGDAAARTGAAHDAAPAWPADAIEVGRVCGAWGVKGWIRVQPHATDAQALRSSREWFLKQDGVGATSVLRIRQVRAQGDAVVAATPDLADRDAAEALKGARVYVSRARFPAPAGDEYYWIDLIGLTVVNRDGAVLGAVADLLDTGAHCVLRVSAGGDAPERLIPFVAAYVDDVDLGARRITVDWGLDY